MAPAAVDRRPVVPNMNEGQELVTASDSMPTRSVRGVNVYGPYKKVRMFPHHQPTL